MWLIICMKNMGCSAKWTAFFSRRAQICSIVACHWRLKSIKLLTERNFLARESFLTDSTIPTELQFFWKKKNKNKRPHWHMKWKYWEVWPCSCFRQNGADLFQSGKMYRGLLNFESFRFSFYVSISMSCQLMSPFTCMLAAPRQIFWKFCKIFPQNLCIQCNNYNKNHCKWWVGENMSIMFKQMCKMLIWNWRNISLGWYAPWKLWQKLSGSTLKGKSAWLDSWPARSVQNGADAASTNLETPWLKDK